MPEHITSPEQTGQQALAEHALWGLEGEEGNKVNAGNMQKWSSDAAKKKGEGKNGE